MKRIRLILLTAAVIIAAGLIKINIINTKAFSEKSGILQEQNIESIKEDFGSEFSKFIQDKSIIKIYQIDGDKYILEVKGQQYIVPGYLKRIVTLEQDLDGIFQKIKAVL